MKLVLFDIDGTILSSSGAGRAAMEHALQHTFGTTGDPAYRYDGKTDRQIVRESMRRVGIDEATIDANIDTVITRYLTALRDTLAAGDRTVQLYEGIAELLDVVHERSDATLGLLTGNVEGGARLKLGAVGLAFDRFVVNAFGSDHEVRNELPRIACQRMHETCGHALTGTDVIVIGDTPADIECGRTIGARTIGVATGHYDVNDLQAHQPTAVFPTLGDTQAVLEVIYAS